jgi:coenzyme F420-reducing hydrogenase gamma subunit
MPKPKVAIISLTSCQGCQFAILDLGQRFFDLNKDFDFVDFKLIKEKVGLGKLDLAFIEGTPNTDGEIKLLKEVRRRSKFLVVLGNCAAMGGIQEIKNYHQPQKIIRQVYQNPQKIANPDIKQVKDFVAVDYTLSTCPINAEEFLQFFYDFLAGKRFKIAEWPVCYECQINQSECLLQRGQLCFGPWIRGGCGAICLKEGQSCWGCRGLLEETDREKMFRTLEKIASREEILKQAEVFGLRDDLEESPK